MANITETVTWDDGVYQLETTDPVEGGEDGVDNAPHKNLANRTLWLKAQLLLKALKNGSATEKFKVANAVADDEAVNKLQMENALAALGVSISDFSNSKAAHGFQKLPGGLIIQWSNPTITGTQDEITLPISFPTAGLFAIVSDAGTASSILAIDNTVFPTLSTVRINISSSTTTLCQVFAIGH